MTREIKFRAWDTKNGWMTDDLFDSTMYVRFDGKVCEDVEEKYNTPNTEIETTGDRYILMQSTGIPDRNGVVIYESDIIKGSAANGVIEWDIDQWVVNPLVDNRGALRLSDDYPSEDLEVIGNIYENPEPLGETS